MELVDGTGDTEGGVGVSTVPSSGTDLGLGSQVAAEIVCRCRSLRARHMRVGLKMFVDGLPAGGDVDLDDFDLGCRLACG